MAEDTAEEVFQAHRGVLFGVAYRVLGGVADAEDVVQEAWLRWADAPRDDVLDPRAYLVRVTTRLAIDRLRRVQARRETYVGPWLPEPLLTGPGTTSPDVADDVVLAESVSMAMLVVLETLSPLERAVFVLREVFAHPYADIAEMLGRREDTVRQLGRRAREHVAERRPRFEADAGARREVTERFLTTCLDGDLPGLMRLLAPDVTLVADSGGLARAPRRVMTGADPIGRFLVGIAGHFPAGVQVVRAQVNGGPAVVAVQDGRATTVLLLDVLDGRVQTVRLLANPDKMSGLRGLVSRPGGGAASS